MLIILASRCRSKKIMAEKMQESQAAFPAEWITGWLKNPLVKKTAIVLVVVAVLGGGYYYSLQKKSRLTPEEAKEKVSSFLTDKVPATAKIEFKDAVEALGMYKVEFSLDGGQPYFFYLTKDGKTLFTEAIDLEEAARLAEEAKKAAEVPKADKPAVDLYVMSFCPYGNKAEDTLKPVYDLLKNKADFNFRYIVSVDGGKVVSLHGEKEVVQNEREACVLKLYGKDKWMNFVTYVNGKCGSDGACWQAGAGTLGINVAQVNGCVSREGVALMKEDAAASGAAGAQGSPTLIINGVESRVVYQYGNSEAYKQAICDAFTTAPEECAQALEADTATSQGGSC